MVKRILPLPSHGGKFPIPNELALINSINDYEEYYSSNKFNFLNKEKNYIAGINWNDNANGKLWLYHLCSFNYLGQESMTQETGIELIQSFNKYLNKKDGLEPYPISLRIINTIKFVIKHDVQDHQINRSLWQDTYILKNNLEYHLLGNHLLENGFALLFSGVYFNDRAIITKAKKILIDQLEEQILDDGAHFELSPMYHSIMLYRVLDTYNLLINNQPEDKDLISLLKEKASMMLGWLDAMTFSNGTLPHFNDSTNGIAPTNKQLKEYATRLKIDLVKSTPNDSGYRVINHDNYELRIDVGHIGPDYIPGHAHNDIFSFELNIDTKPFIVNTGISTYETSERRTLERSTSTHNTVQVANIEQTETWASFRVGKRNYPEIITENNYKIIGKYKYPSENVIHSRSFSWDHKEINISDHINLNKKAKVQLHFHPNVNVELNNNKVVTCFGTINFEGVVKSHLTEYKYAQGFNNLIDAKMVSIEFTDKVVTTIRI